MKPIRFKLNKRTVLDIYLPYIEIEKNDIWISFDTDLRICYNPIEICRWKNNILIKQQIKGMYKINFEICILGFGFLIDTYIKL